MEESDTKFAEFLANKICNNSDTVEDAIASAEQSVPEGRRCGELLMRDLVIENIQNNPKFSEV